MDRVTRGEDHETKGGWLPVTLRTQGTINPSDKSIRSAEKAGIRPGGMTGARVSSLSREGEAGKAGARRLEWVACLTLEAWLGGGESRETLAAWLRSV